jgi:hypothetical protein
MPVNNYFCFAFLDVLQHLSLQVKASGHQSILCSDMFHLLVGVVAVSAFWGLYQQLFPVKK